MNIMVINACNWYNKGDVANRVGLIKAMKAAFNSRVKIFITSQTPHEDSQYFRKYKVRVVKDIFAIEEKFYIFKMLKATKEAFLSIFSLMLFKMLRVRPYQEFLRTLINADIVVCAPGIVFAGFSISHLANLFEVIISLFIRKPVVIYAQNIEPIKGWLGRFLMKIIFNQIGLITLREERSYHLLREMGVTKPEIYITADATFSLLPIRDEKIEEKFSGLFSDDSLRIGISVCGRISSLKEPKIYQRYIDVMAKTIDEVIGKLNAHIYFIPQTLSQSDMSTLKEIYSLVRNKGRVTIIMKDLSPEEVMAIIGCIDLFIGTRMHSNIFALIMNTPTIAIAYEHKTYGIMKMLGLENWVIDVKDIDERKLVSRIEELYNSRFEIKKNILKAVQIARIKSMLNAKIVRTWCERSLKNQ